MKLNKYSLTKIANTGNRY